MSEIHEFINEVAAIAQNGQPEAAQKELVAQAFDRWVEETRKMYSREEYPDASFEGGSLNCALISRRQSTGITQAGSAS